MLSEHVVHEAESQALDDRRLGCRRVEAELACNAHEALAWPSIAHRPDAVAAVDDVDDVGEFMHSEDAFVYCEANGDTKGNMILHCELRTGLRISFKDPIGECEKKINSKQRVIDKNSPRPNADW